MKYFVNKPINSKRGSRYAKGHELNQDQYERLNDAEKACCEPVNEIKHVVKMMQETGLVADDKPKKAAAKKQTAKETKQKGK